MQNPIHQIFDRLGEFSLTMRLRQEAYQHASLLPEFPEPERDKLQHCASESVNSLTFMEERLEDISANVSAVPSRPKTPLTCGLYYAIAKSTGNLLTVQLSLQLGDLWFLKKFEEYYHFLDFDQFRTLKEEAARYIACLKSGIYLSNPKTIIPNWS